MPFPAANLRRRRSHPQTDTSSAALNFASIQQQVGPFFVQLATAYSTIEPAITTIISLIQQIWTFLQPYHPEDLVVALYGFFLVFFGGVFMTLVACAEAAHQFGWPRIRAACSALYHEAHNARLAFERDNNVSYRLYYSRSHLTHAYITSYFSPLSYSFSSLFLFFYAYRLIPTAMVLQT